MKVIGFFVTVGGAALGAALILRVCDERYSATQYALLSSLFGLGRFLAGLPPAGSPSG